MEVLGVQRKRAGNADAAFSQFSETLGGDSLPLLGRERHLCRVHGKELRRGSGLRGRNCGKPLRSSGLQGLRTESGARLIRRMGEGLGVGSWIKFHRDGAGHE